jgi:hypothetical protein
MTDFDFAGFLDTDNQKEFVISLINLFDSIISEDKEENIRAKINKVTQNSISKDFGGLIAEINKFDNKITSKISLLSVINLITPNLSVSDSLNDEWEKSTAKANKTILRKLESFSTDEDLRLVAQISEWINKNNSNAIILQKMADLINSVDNFAFFKEKLQSSYPDKIENLLNELDSERKQGFVQNDVVKILIKKGVNEHISSLVTQEAMSEISNKQLISNPVLQIEINENGDPENAFEVMELIPEIGVLLTSTAGNEDGTFIFLVLSNTENSVQELNRVNAKYKEFK